MGAGRREDVPWHWKSAWMCAVEQRSRIDEQEQKVPDAVGRPAKIDHRRRIPVAVEEPVRPTGRHAPGRRPPNRKRDIAPASAAAPDRRRWAWPNGNTPAPTRSEYRPC